MTIREKIAIILAYDDGNEIELREIGCEKWHKIKEPKFNFAKFDYRIAENKTERNIDDEYGVCPFYVKYENATQILEDMKIHGPFVKVKAGKTKHSYVFEEIEVDKRNECVYFSSWQDEKYRNFEPISRIDNKLLEWQDGSPFGHLINE